MLPLVVPSAWCGPHRPNLCRPPRVPSVPCRVVGVPGRLADVEVLPPRRGLRVRRRWLPRVVSICVAAGSAVRWRGVAFGLCLVGVSAWRLLTRVPGVCGAPWGAGTACAHASKQVGCTSCFWGSVRGARLCPGASTPGTARRFNAVCGDSLRGDSGGHRVLFRCRLSAAPCCRWGSGAVGRRRGCPAAPEGLRVRRRWLPRWVQYRCLAAGSGVWWG